MFIINPGAHAQARIDMPLLKKQDAPLSNRNAILTIAIEAAGRLKYVGDVKQGPNAEIGSKDYFAKSSR